MNEPNGKVEGPVLLLDQWFSEGMLCPLGTLSLSGDTFDRHDGGRACHWHLEVGDVGKHCTMHRLAPSQGSPSVSSAKVEER